MYLLLLLITTTNAYYTIQVDLENSVPGSSNDAIYILDDGIAVKSATFIVENDQGVQVIQNDQLVIRNKLNPLSAAKLATVYNITVIDILSSTTVRSRVVYPIEKSFDAEVIWYIGYVTYNSGNDNYDLTPLISYEYVRLIPVTISIDLQRNMIGSGLDEVVAIEDELNHMYFLVTGKDAIYTEYTIDLGSLMKVITGLETVLLRLSMDSVSEFGEDLVIYTNETVLMQNYPNSIANFTFQLIRQTELTLLSCLNDAIRIKLPVEHNESRVTVLGQEAVSDCTFIIYLDGTKEISIPMGACGLTFDVAFTLRFNSVNGFYGLNDDVKVQMLCSRLYSEFLLLSNDAVVSRYKSVDSDDDIVRVQEIQALMFLHAQDDISHIITTEELPVKTPVSLKIELDSLYVNSYDIIPLLCTANGQTILDNSCAVYPFANFTRESTGSYTSNFNMFRTVKNGISDTSVNFNCIMSICELGSCGIQPTCIQ